MNDIEQMMSQAFALLCRFYEASKEVGPEVPEDEDHVCTKTAMKAEYVIDGKTYQITVEEKESED